MAVLLDASLEEPVRAICARRGDRPDELIEILHEIQQARGWISDDALRVVADALNLSRAEVHGVVSFYHDFRRAPPARHRLQLCRAEACQGGGADALAAGVEAALGCKTGERSADGAIDVEAVYCLGNCALGPAAMIDGRLIGRATPERLKAELARIHEGEA